jgi:ABC-2 type transport system ATP-binding protein
VSERKDGLTAIEVTSQAGRDIRQDLAAAVVNRGWGLLELRPMRMSLEDVFLTLTTIEPDAPAAPAPNTEAA